MFKGAKMHATKHPLDRRLLDLLATLASKVSEQRKKGHQLRKEFYTVCQELVLALHIWMSGGPVRPEEEDDEMDEDGAHRLED